MRTAPMALRRVVRLSARSACGAMVKPTAARPVPNTVATKNASATSEVADLSEMPGKVDATQEADVEADLGE